MPHILSLSQWMASGHPGASGPRAARSAPTGAGGSAQPQRRRTGGRTARGWCCSPRTARTGSACRVSAAMPAPGSGKYVAVEKPARCFVIKCLLLAGAAVSSCY